MTRPAYICDDCGRICHNLAELVTCCDPINELHDPSLDPAEEFTIGKRDAPVTVDTHPLGITARAYGDNPAVILGED
jgi:hypothetical protein